MLKVLLLAIAASFAAVGVVVVVIAPSGGDPRDHSIDLTRVQFSDEVLGDLRDRAHMDAQGRSDRSEPQPSAELGSSSPGHLDERSPSPLTEAELRREQLISSRDEELKGLMPFLIGGQGALAEIQAAAERAAEVSAMLLMDAAGTSVDLSLQEGASLGPDAPPGYFRLEDSGYRYDFDKDEFPAHDVMELLTARYPAGISLKELPMRKVVDQVNRARDAAQGRSHDTKPS